MEGSDKAVDQHIDEVLAWLESHDQDQPEKEPAEGLPALPAEEVAPVATSPAVEAPPAALGPTPIVTTAPGTPRARSASSDAYQFPSTDPTFIRLLGLFRGKPAPTLVAWLRKLSHGKQDWGLGKRLGYAEIRNHICAMSIALNQAGWPAPRMRDLRRPKRPNESEPDDGVLSNDRQVIDIHWLWCQKHEASKAALQDLLGADEFDYKRASHYIRTRGSPSDKVKDLGVDERKQLLLASLQTDKVRQRWVSIFERRTQMEAQLLNRVASTKARLDRAAIPPRLDVFVALLIERGEVSSAVRTLRLLSGSEMSIALMKKRKAELGRMGESFE